MLEEKISRHLKIPYVELERNGKKYYLCNNGVIFADSEYMDFADLNAEYERRAKEDKLYDYNYAKSTGLLRKKRGYPVKTIHSESDKETAEKDNSLEAQKKTVQVYTKEIPTVHQEETKRGMETDRQLRDEAEHTQSKLEGVPNTAEKGYESTDRFSYSPSETRSNKRSDTDRWNSSLSDRQHERGKSRSSFLIILILAFASVCSMYESTLHTATYLYDYVDLISAWLLSTAVTAYNSSAFEVSVMFHTMKRNFMAFIFMLLWAMVTVFSMATTVSVFYDRFNFNETQIAQENKAVDSNKLGLELLRTKEKDLRESIEFKKKDIEYRQERDYATTAVRLELESLQKELQENLTEQQKLLEETPEVIEEKLQKKESLFSFLGRMIGLEGGILEFIMSTLSAIFINLIAPLSLTAVIELNKRKEK
jgi:hypothetical protein